MGEEAELLFPLSVVAGVIVSGQAGFFVLRSRVLYAEYEQLLMPTVRSRLRFLIVQHLLTAGTILPALYTDPAP